MELEFLHNPSWWKFGLDVTQSVVLVVGIVYAFVARRTTANREEIQTLRRAHGNLEKRIEVQAATAPTKKDIETLHSRITDVLAELKRLEGQFQGNQNITNLLHHKELNE